MYDFHIHSRYSEDAEDFELRELADAACAKGLRGICVTDHLDIDYPSDEMTFGFMYDSYNEDMNALKDLYSDRLEIFKGIELGLQPHVGEANRAFLKNKDFDFIIGSLHCVGNKELYKNCYLEGITDEAGILWYFDDMLKCLADFGDFDVLGHLDVVRRYLSKGEKSFSYEAYKGMLHSVLSRLINSNKGIELNTSGLRYGLSSFHPMPQILKLYRFLGGEIVTLGSDAHRPADLAYEFKAALQLLKNVGFHYYTIFSERRPYFLKIEE